MWLGGAAWRTNDSLLSDFDDFQSHLPGTLTAPYESALLRCRRTILKIILTAKASRKWLCRAGPAQVELERAAEWAKLWTDSPLSLAATFNVSYFIKSQAGGIMMFLMKSLLALAPSRETKVSLNLEAPLLFQVTICHSFIISSANRIMGGRTLLS
jgi:hypothetical protein